MMREEIRKEKMEKYGCISWCPEKERQCFYCVTDDGACSENVCIIETPEHQAMKERQKQVIRERESAESRMHPRDKAMLEVARAKEAKARELSLNKKSAEAKRLLETAKIIRGEIFAREKEREI